MSFKNLTLLTIFIGLVSFSAMGLSKSCPISTDLEESRRIILLEQRYLADQIHNIVKDEYFDSDYISYNAILKKSDDHITATRFYSGPKAGSTSAEYYKVTLIDIDEIGYEGRTDRVTVRPLDSSYFDLLEKLYNEKQ